MKVHPKINPQKILKCAYCGNNTVHAMTYREDFSEVIDETMEGDPIWDDCWLAILKCTTCGKPSVYRDEWDDKNKKWTTGLVYPTQISAPKEVPVKIREAFDEAISVIQRSPSLCAVGIRKCLEGICENEKAEGHTLEQKINYLGTSGILPKTLFDMMNTSRIFGNIGAHFRNSNVTLDDLQTLIEFINAIFVYIYVAPARLESVKNTLDKRKITNK